MNKDFVFYSDYCQHSKRLLDLINKTNLSSSLVLCNIDNEDVEIPPFITCVPTLYLAGQKQILMNNELFEWINNNVNKNTNNNLLQNVDITGDNNISAFQENEIGSNFSDSYSFINDDNKTALNHTFSFIDNENTIPSHTKSNEVNVDNNNGGGGSNDAHQQSMLNKAYDQLLSQRDNEIPQNISAARI